MPHERVNLKHRAAIFLFLFAIAAFNFIGWPLQIRFTNLTLNYWFSGALALSIPLSLGWFCFALPNRRARVAGVALSVIALLPGVLFALLAITEAPSIGAKDDPSFELLSDARLDQSHYRLYRTNCGATCAYGLSLRREIDSPVGFKFVWPLWSKYREDEGTIKVVGTSEIQVFSGEYLLFAYVP